MLTGEGVFLQTSGPATVTLRYDGASGRYLIAGETGGEGTDQPAASREEMVAVAKSSRFVAGEGTQGGLDMQFRLQSSDELVLAIQLGEQPVSNIRMVRAE